MIPAKARATGNKGSKKKEMLSVREMVQWLKAERQFRMAVKRYKAELREKARQNARRSRLGKMIDSVLGKA